MRERRRYVRSNGLVVVEYKGLKIKGKSSAFDVSGVGLRITIDVKLNVGTQVEMDIYLPSDSRPIKAEGNVVWVEKCTDKTDVKLGPKKEYFYNGIELTHIDENDRKKIALYVHKKFHLPKR
ncbi:MAG: PilZ domain-containing protein [Candidatus Omnitrophica bacterium]|nr:PilZ domain-containing protein [Candidatus Omnitrophota bacterium]